MQTDAGCLFRPSGPCVERSEGGVGTRSGPRLLRTLTSCLLGLLKNQQCPFTHLSVSILTEDGTERIGSAALHMNSWLIVHLASSESCCLQVNPHRPPASLLGLHVHALGCSNAAAYAKSCIILPGRGTSSRARVWTATSISLVFGPPEIRCPGL